MCRNHYTTKERKFKHLTKEKRAQIKILLKQKTSKAKIATLLGILHSTLYEELKRGTVRRSLTQV